MTRFEHGWWQSAGQLATCVSISHTLATARRNKSHCHHICLFICSFCFPKYPRHRSWMIRDLAILIPLTMGNILYPGFTPNLFRSIIIIQWGFIPLLPSHQTAYAYNFLRYTVSSSADNTHILRTFPSCRGCITCISRQLLSRSHKSQWKITACSNTHTQHAYNVVVNILGEYENPSNMHEWVRRSRPEEDLTLERAEGAMHRKRDGPLLSASASHTASKQSGQNLMIYYRCCCLASGTVHWSERNCVHWEREIHQHSTPCNLVICALTFASCCLLSGAARKTKKQHTHTHKSCCGRYTECRHRHS